MPEPPGEFVRHGPGGEPLTHGRRLTYRDARTWLKRHDAVLGWERCGGQVAWVPESERATEASAIRHLEGRDCSVAGDVLLYRLADGRPVLIIEEPL